MVTLRSGLVWGVDGTGEGGSKALTTAGGLLTLGGSAVPISALAAGTFSITVQLEADSAVTSTATVRVTASSHTLAWTPSAAQPTIASEPFAVDVVLTGTADGAPRANLAVTVTPSADLAWAADPQGPRTLTTDAEGLVTFPAGTFIPTTAAMHTLTAQLVTDPAAKATLKVFAVPREALSWVKDVYVLGGKLFVTLLTTAFQAANRIVVTVNGAYAGETYSAGVYNAAKVSADASATTVELTDATLTGAADRVAVSLAPGQPGWLRGGEYVIAQRTLAVPPAGASAWVKSVAPSGGKIGIEIDAAVYRSAYRLVYRINGGYAGENQSGTSYYGGLVDNGSTVTRTFSGTAGSNTVDVFLADGSVGSSTAGRVAICLTRTVTL